MGTTGRDPGSGSRLRTRLDRHRPYGRAPGLVGAAGTVITRGPDRGIVHLTLAPGADDGVAASVVLHSLAVLTERPAEHAQVCLPAPHPAVRALLAAGWRFDEFDVFMGSEPGLLDPRRAVPSPGQA